ncbi:MAG TPA: SPOR domain-containing protein [Gemmatimonadales bacterium]|nr:SPOR domain-containing protein [Gemmatimonadales bacterium]
MRIRRSCFLLASLALWGCRSRAPAAPSAQPPVKQSVSKAAAGAARTGGVAIRIPAKGGVPRVYRLPGLVEMPSAIRGKLPAVVRVVGLDPEAEVLYVVCAGKDTTAKKGVKKKKDTSPPKYDVLALDLGSARVDTVATTIEQATLGPDGTLYAIDAKGHVVSVARRIRVAWPQPLPGVPQQLFAAADQRLVVADPPSLVTAAADQPPTSRPMPTGSDVAATRWGDLVAVAADSGVVLMDPLGRREPAFVRLSDHPRAIGFSPSGHRIYVARRTEPGLAAIDRYDREEIDGIALPLPAVAIRLDPLGRFLLAKPSLGDSVWVVDLPVKRLVGSVASAWRADLPAIAPDGALLVRQGDDVVAYRSDSLVEVGRAKGGAADLWASTAWRPRGAYRGAFADADVTTAQTADTAAGADGQMYVQVSTSQNEAWSSEMAKQLTGAGLAARVLEPKNPDDGYRVVLGPYPTRAQAEAIGRKLGRPFWIYQPTP